MTLTSLETCVRKPRQLGRPAVCAGWGEGFKEGVDTMADIFISYSHEDRARVQAIHALLEQERYSVAIDQDIPAGAFWREWLDHHLREASVVIVLWSRQSAAKGTKGEWVRVEADVARKNSVLVPLIVDDLRPDEIPMGFGERQWLCCAWEADGQLAPESRRRLLDALRSHVDVFNPLNNAITQLRAELETRVGAHYEQFEKIGSGRMSVVFKARHRVLGRYDAIRVFPLAGILLFPGFLSQFKQSIEVAQRLKHHNILDIRELRMEDAIAYTTMEYVQGALLSQCIRDPMPLERVKGIATQLATALAFAHSEGVVHCNLRSSNVLIEISNDRPRITDFGLADMSGGIEFSALTSALFNDPRYMSPEQCRRESVTARTDQYSLGIILYEMLTGELPFTGKSAFAIMQQQCEKQPPPMKARRGDCPPEIMNTVMQLLQKQPDQRFMMTRDLVKTIEAWPTYTSHAGRSKTRKRDAATAVQEVKQSYEHCLVEKPEFIGDFYKRLRADPELNEYLRHLNFDHQVKALQKSIPRLFEIALGSPEADRYLQELAFRHQGLKLQAAHLQTFSKALIALAIETDPWVKDAPDRGRSLRRDWERAMKPGMARIVELLGTEPHAAPL